MLASTPPRSFRDWVARNARRLSSQPLKNIVDLYGAPVSQSAAYRACRSVGLKGLRSNATRYAKFWSAVNWRLPNTVLASIWEVDYGNLRARRERLRIGPPKWRAVQDASDPVYMAAVAVERVKARRFPHPKPN